MGLELLGKRIVVCAREAQGHRFADALRSVGATIREAPRDGLVGETAQWVPAAVIVETLEGESAADLEALCVALRKCAAPLRLAIVAIVPAGDPRTRERAEEPGPDGVVADSIAVSLLGPYVAGLIEALSVSLSVPARA